MKTDAELHEEWMERQRIQKRIRRQPAIRSSQESVFLAEQAKYLLNQPEWDWIQRNLSEWMIHKKQSLEVIEGRFSASKATSDQDLRDLRESGIILRAEIALLEEVLEMPGKAVENGQQALKNLKAVETDAKA